MNLTRNQRLTLLGVLILLAFAIRIHNLDAMSFWHDEGLTPVRAGYDFAKILRNEIDIQGWATRDTHPPLYYLVAHVGERLLGGTDFAWRYLPLLFGVLLVPVVFQIGRKIHSDTIGLIAALFAAVNPLQVWYAQEARMYTLAVLLMALASYALWRALAGDRNKKRLVGWLLFYVILAGLAFWTHYTAAFLILGQGILWAWLLWHAGLKKWLVGGAVLAFLLTLPLLPLVTSRLLSDAPETGYTTVPPWVIVEDVVRGFVFGRTVDHNALLIQVFTIGLWLLLLAGIVYRRKAENAWLSRLFLLIYLFATPLGLIVGSALFKPMYLGVRHIMVGSPALFILLARGASLFWPQPAERHKKWGMLHSAVAILGITIVLWASHIALDNLYHDIRFTKEDYRGMVAYIESHAGANDVVLYHNALLMPLHEHYRTRDDIAVTALPTYPHGAHPGTIDDLLQLFADYDRVWYMAEPPPDNRDPENVVGAQIEGKLLPIDERWFHGVNTEMKITAYQSVPFGVETLPSDAVAQTWQGDGLPVLRGARLGMRPEKAVDNLWVDLFWDAAAPSAEHGVQLALRAPDGELLAKNVAPFYMDAAPPLPDTTLQRTNYQLELPDSLPPGMYELLVGSWDYADETGSGEWEPLLEVEIAGSSAESDPNTGLHFANGLHLVDVISTEAVKPGHPLPVTLVWQTSTPFADSLRYQLEVIDHNGDVLRVDGGVVGPSWLSVGHFPTDIRIAQPIGIYFPPETAPGQFSLRWTVFDGDEPVPSRFGRLPWRSDANLFGEVTVEAWPLITELKPVDNLVTVGDNLFINVGKVRAYVQNGDSLTLYWEATGDAPQSYTVFVHVVPSGGIEAVTQSDRIPVDWLRPTDGWRPGEILEDIHNLGISPLPPGDYDIFVGFYDPETLVRVPVSQNGIPMPNDVLLLTTITVP